MYLRDKGEPLHMPLMPMIFFLWLQEYKNEHIQHFRSAKFTVITWSVILINPFPGSIFWSAAWRFTDPNKAKISLRTVIPGNDSDHTCTVITFIPRSYGSKFAIQCIVPWEHILLNQSYHHTKDVNRGFFILMHWMRKRFPPPSWENKNTLLGERRWFG